MSKHLVAPASRLVFAGQAKACTNANGGEKRELDGGAKFD